MLRYALFLSVRPLYAARILEGRKTVELRRVRPRVSKGAVLLLYVSSPVKALKAISMVDRVTSAQPDMLWEQIAHKAGVSRDEFDEYFDDARLGFAIHLSDVQLLSHPVSLAALRKLWPGFTPPQGYQYFTQREFSELLLLTSDSDKLAADGSYPNSSSC